MNDRQGGKPENSKPVAATGAHADVQAFLRQVALAPRPAPGAAAGRGRLIFAMDATFSRRPTWDEAQRVHAEMFKAAAGLGGLEIQLVFFRGVGECRASGWVSEAPALLKLMRQVECVGGHTQIERVLRHALAETRERKVNALVYVGDALEESPDDVLMRAGELAMLGVPVFAFQEGNDPKAQACLKEMARITRGAYCAFDASSAAMLAQLLSAVAVYAAGGYAALENHAKAAGGAAKLLTSQMK